MDECKKRHERRSHVDFRSSQWFFIVLCPGNRPDGMSFTITGCEDEKRTMSSPG